MNRRAFWVLLACFATLFTSYLIRYSYGVMLPEMLPSLQITKAQAGVIYSSYFIAYSLASPALGLVSDRYKVRLLIPAFLAVMGVGAFLMSYASSVLTASLYFTLAGIGAAACWAPVVALAQRWASEKRRGVILAAIDVGSSVGVIAAGAAIPAIVVAHSWRTGWVSLGAVVLLVVVIDIALIRDRPAEKPSTGTLNLKASRQDTPVTIYQQFIRKKEFWLLGVAYLLTGFSILIPFAFLSTYMVQERAFSYESANLFIMMIGFGAMVGKPVMGMFSDRLGRIKMLLLCALMIGLGNACMVVSGGTQLLVISVLVFGWGYGSVWALYAACASDYFPRRVSGSIVGFWTLLLGIGSLASPVIAGWLADTTGTLTWGFYMAATGILLSIPLLLPVIRAPLDNSKRSGTSV